jgi:hypothetical protein
MAVTLALAYTERNDNKLLTLTDVSTDWGTPAVGAITTLTLDVSITTSNNVTTVYDQFNLITFADPDLDWTSQQSNLVWQFTPDDFVSSGVTLGSSTDIFPDGIYTFLYKLDDGLATESTLSEEVLMEGNVRNSIYKLLRTIPTLYTCNECKSGDILDIIFMYGYLNSIRAGGYVAKTEELINQLYVLERLLLYGSSYSW